MKTKDDSTATVNAVVRWLRWLLYRHERRWFAVYETGERTRLMTLRDARTLAQIFKGHIEFM